MLKTVKATIEKNGEVHLLESVQLTHSCRAIVTIIEKEENSDIPDIPETALLSEQTLAYEWERPEEDAAWSHLQ